LGQIAAAKEQFSTVLKMGKKLSQGAKEMLKALK
jgi:hypothetical protein